MTRPCPAPDYDTRPPKVKPPPRAYCTQAHVFGLADKFPYSEGRGYTPPDAGIETYLNLLYILGLNRSVIVHGSAHGSNNRASLDGIARAPDRLRGIAVVDPEISDVALEELDAGGMRGIRLSTMLKGGVGSEQLAPMADKIRGLGWHIVLHVNDSKEIAELNSSQRNLPVPIVIDHLSRVRGGQGVDYVGFQALLRLMWETDHVWGKISSWYRLTDIGPPYDDMTPIACAMIAARPDRIIWGTNWPHPILWDHLLPNDGDLFNQLMDWAADDATRHQILVDNPAALYGFDP